MPDVCTQSRKAVLSSLERIHLASPQTTTGMTVWPLLGPSLDGLAYDMLDKAMQKGTCEVREHTSPLVDSVVVVNKSDTPVLAMHGQLLQGAKQNRSLNLTTMFPPNSETPVHVACIEQGRWNKGQSFQDARWMQSAAGRTEKLSDVLSNLQRTGSSTAQQDRVWNQQSVKERRLGLRSDTHDEIEIQKLSLRDHAESLIETCACETDQVGAIIYANNSLAIEIFDSHDAYSQCHEALLKSFMVEAIEALGRHISPPKISAGSLLNKIWEIPWRAIDAPGSGTGATGSVSETKAYALVYQNVCVCMSVSGFLSQI